MKAFKHQQKLMGSLFEFTIYEHDSHKARHLIQLAVEEIERIEQMLTEFSNDSVTNLVNKNAGLNATEVPPEFHNLVKRSIKISELTQGAFDLTTSPLKNQYIFDGSIHSLPQSNQINRTLELVGFDKIHLANDKAIYLTKKGMKISFASIGKGYAADCVKNLWMNQGIKSAAISAGGDLCVIGLKPGNAPWQVAIPDPNHPDKTLIQVAVKRGSVATSGNYFQFFTSEKKEKFGHTINPKTGYPVVGVKSVSIFGPQAELCDALATAVTVMGHEAGFCLIEQLPGFAGMAINENDEVITTKNANFDKT